MWESISWSQGGPWAVDEAKASREARHARVATVSSSVPSTWKEEAAFLRADRVPVS